MTSIDNPLQKKVDTLEDIKTKISTKFKIQKENVCERIFKQNKKKEKLKHLQHIEAKLYNFTRV